MSSIGHCKISTVLFLWLDQVHFCINPYSCVLNNYPHSWRMPLAGSCTAPLADEPVPLFFLEGKKEVASLLLRGQGFHWRLTYWNNTTCHWTKHPHTPAWFRKSVPQKVLSKVLWTSRKGSSYARHLGIEERLFTGFVTLMDFFLKRCSEIYTYKIKS